MDELVVLITTGQYWVNTGLIRDHAKASRIIILSVLYPIVDCCGRIRSSVERALDL